MDDFKKQQVNDSHEVHTSYFSPNCAVASWNTQGESHISSENGNLSNSCNNQLVEPAMKIVQDGSNVAPTISSSTSVSATVGQGYSGYATYSNTDPYGYSSTGYAAYYSPYQQKPGQYQQQPSPYQLQASQYPQQPPQYQEQLTQYSQQPNQSYPHHVGAYQNTGAPYQPLSSFQNTGSYAGPASYPSTYYNPGDYQTSGSYTSSSYGTQTNSWDGGQYATYGSQQYQNYTQDSNSAYSSTSAVASSQYQQHYQKQWEDYYNQSQAEVSCAPGTEKLSVPVVSSVSTSVPSGCLPQTTINQMPTAYTVVWNPESSSSEMTSVQSVPLSGSTHVGYLNHGPSAFHNDPSNSVQLQAPKPPEVTPTYEGFQNQQNSTYIQGSTAMFQASYPVSQDHQSSLQTVSQPSEPLDSLKAPKLQMSANPRIAPNLPLNQVKNEQGSSVTGGAAKPAYISVPMQKPDEIFASNDEVDTTPKPGVFPKSLRGYVERALARCKTDRQKAVCQAIMKEIITKTTSDGTLYTKDWDMEPLFPMPNADSVGDNTQLLMLSSAMPKSRSPSRRAKSRWEPVPEEKVVHKSATISPGTAVHGSWNYKQVSGGKTESKGNLGSRVSFTYQKGFSKNAARPAKRLRLGEDLNTDDAGEPSSDSDKEQCLTKYYSAATTLANSPEEKKKRENRSRRFDKGHGNRAGKSNFRVSDVGTGIMHSRRANALVLSRTLEESGSRAVEDIDWNALTVKGTCQEIEKRYLRLTSAPDPATVRPEEVLEKALLMVQNSPKNYLYKCDQLKSIRQDLTVQHIHNELTVKVYETHARLAIEVGDLPEYNQCQSQLKTLYAEGIMGCHMEFAAYNLLCVIMHSNNNRDLLSAMSRLPADAKKDKAIKHALSVRSAVTSGNYVMFFRLYKMAPNLNTFLMDLYVEKMRYAAVKCIARSYRPTVPVAYLSQILGFTNALPTTEPDVEKELDGMEECLDWLKAHGACVIVDSSGETLLDAKASASTLFMPEPEDAVSHGDASLAVNDFLTRSLV